MYKPGVSIDITGNYKAIESLKASILKSVSELYENMSPGGYNLDNIIESLSSVIINSYNLADKIGIDKEVLEDFINKRRC